MSYVPDLINAKLVIWDKCGINVGYVGSSDNVELVVGMTIFLNSGNNNRLVQAMVVPVAQGAQALCGSFGRQVALWHTQHFVTYHELAHRGGTQQGWVIMGMQMPLGISRPIRWRLVETHGIGEGDLEQVIVASGDAA